MESTLRLRQYLDLRAKQLGLDLEAATLFLGKTETGTVAEDAIRRFLAASLPARYAVGLGEVVSVEGQTNRQTQAKDVIVYDSAYSPIFGWGDTGFHLFPIESVYAVIEVKKVIDAAELGRGVKQATEARKLLGQNPKRPFTAVVAFESRVRTETLARTMGKLPPQQRVDFVLILTPPSAARQPADDVIQGEYIAHWYYYEPGTGGGHVDFAMVWRAAEEEEQIASGKGEKRHIYLTWAQHQNALMWFYLFLTLAMAPMKAQPPDLWGYAGAEGANLGYRGNC